MRLLLGGTLVDEAFSESPKHRIAAIPRDGKNNSRKLKVAAMQDGPNKPVTSGRAPSILRCICSINQDVTILYSVHLILAL